MSKQAGDGRRETGRRRRGRLDDARPLRPRTSARSRGVRVVYVACEGESTEPDYLQYLNEQFGEGGDHDRPPFRIQPVYRKNGMSPLRVVEAVREIAGEDEAWALFDRDQWDEIPAAIRVAAEARIEIAMSHPSFDLWLLLHFQPFGGAQSGSSKLVVEKLRRAAGTDAFKDYDKRDDKRDDKSVRHARRDALKGRETKAVANARRLVASCPHGLCTPVNAMTEPIGRDSPAQSPWQWSARSGHHEDCPVLGRDPSTDVWRLLTSLGIRTDGG
ncbi:hypothetical protein Sme01_25730 [Sphaerisporangium melleum]|uniref:RloB domain-containing protein n=1 Tax=Sphaerisporangium melleum TaxID=321316 RepID=A0A917VD47_9ACTN|nr:RloB family protein [Sphaerisporangium melleum]GGK64347.1 hypothetical protein GCM10007964_04210 [Sphaerisporangium melleum]GII70097.1 hypothetical protein Sme01_25730 [Sphaerisporangium melleum]